MALTLRQHKIAALKQARKVIIKPINGDGMYGLCNALYTYIADDPVSTTSIKAVRELNTYISRKLGKHSYLQDWLVAKGNIPKHQWVTHRDPRMVATRVAWIDWMIQCLEEDEANEANGSA